MARKPFNGVIKLAYGDMKSQLGKFPLSGDGLCVGATVEKAQYLDPEKLATGALAAD